MPRIPTEITKPDDDGPSVPSGPRPEPRFAVPWSALALVVVALAVIVAALIAL